MEQEKLFITVQEASALTGISVASCYKLIRKTNLKLQKQGYLTVAGKCPRKAFLNALGIEC